jgi:hypothetical protein
MSTNWQERQAELSALLDGMNKADLASIRSMAGMRVEDIQEEEQRISQVDVSRGEFEALLGRVTLLEFGSQAQRACDPK